MTPLAMAALALLSERPMHPYEMYQTLIQRSEDRIVKVRPGSLYHTINKLDGLGLVRATGIDREGNRPERTTYEITERGSVALAERIASVIESPEYEFPIFPVAISQAHHLPHETVVTLLERRLHQLDVRRDEIAAGVRKLDRMELPRKYWLDVDYLHAQFDAERSWLERVIAEIRSGALDWTEEKKDD
ncbi:PadR family transcriptional regulator [Gryllotalpicola reticulitermitis]|uniref:PadR family transcriptional regulator n=1 Tax=Gryllotalpicola reticulitermitis TaxID=1184153 RepID=A0ABV8Q8I9_9MICO